MQDEYPHAIPVAAPLLLDLRAATQAMRDTVRGIDPHTNTLGANLLDQIREYVARLISLTPLPIVFNPTGIQDARPVKVLLHQQFCAIFKEAVTNALHHAVRSRQIRGEQAQQVAKFDLRKLAAFILAINCQHSKKLCHTFCLLIPKARQKRPFLLLERPFLLGCYPGRAFSFL